MKDTSFDSRRNPPHGEVLAEVERRWRANLPRHYPRLSIPDGLRAYGLADAHHHPLVGERQAGRFRAMRTTPGRAWDYPYVELRTATSFTSIVVDVDRDVRGVMDGWDFNEAVPPPSFAVIRKSNLHAHVGWFLRAPVHRYPHAKPKPLLQLARVADYLNEALSGDPGYTGVTCHNPDAWRVGFLRHFGAARGGWTLTGLADYIPEGWKRPAQRLTGIGRNCDTFAASMKWAGRACNRGRSVWEPATAFNELNEPRLGESELRGIVRSVERYRDVWEANGFHRPSWIAKQAARGRLSGATRREAVRDRDHDIIAARATGASLRAIAADFGLTPEGVRYILNRGVK